MDFDDQIEQFLLLDDLMKISIIGFSIIESEIEKLIYLGLGYGHQVEVKKMSVKMKVDLAIALGTFPHSYKGILGKLADLRNAYAHKVYISSAPEAINHIKSSLSSSQHAALKIKNSHTDTMVVRYAILSTILVARQCAKNFSYRLKQKSKPRPSYTAFPGLSTFDTTAIEKQMLSIAESFQTELVKKCAYEALSKLDM
ncbi:hypothetical protein BFX22_18045 [Vibrio cholerae]|uniref:hypothetical protein n=1 Tax=Vibrio TaxID=662 RepID=UPI000893829F|nr:MULTISPECIES: hypothetical protein [Vibrio]EGQ9613149.1 hypothetical protein [Vibrio cholerae]EGR5155379.1 hypothetical protein [Vibrio cholerae]EJL6300123.1 hypothetical protein [Vibrio cholerae]OFI96822.1 hypothetical protein BFX22_18045 [Vibrio cholerae]OFJ07966.1 hypothetical protein BFX25_17575 [Vibrio cholerae]